MLWLLEKEGLQGAVDVDSAGTGGWHVGERADARARETALQRGIQLTSRSRKVVPADFDRFDYIVAMDLSNAANLRRLAATDAQRQRISLLRAFDGDSPPGAEVPDPYYGGPGGFDEVLDICEAGCRGLLEHIRQAHGL